MFNIFRVSQFNRKQTQSTYYRKLKNLIISPHVWEGFHSNSICYDGKFMYSGVVYYMYVQLKETEKDSVELRVFFKF